MEKAVRTWSGQYRTLKSHLEYAQFCVLKNPSNAKDAGANPVAKKPNVGSRAIRLVTPGARSWFGHRQAQGCCFKINYRAQKSSLAVKDVELDVHVTGPQRHFWDGRSALRVDRVRHVVPGTSIDRHMSACRVRRNDHHLGVSRQWHMSPLAPVTYSRIALQRREPHLAALNP